jgi:hypothetical protein
MTISVHVDVQAENADEARKKAEDCGVMNLCNQCANNQVGEWSTSGELDGDVTVSLSDDVIEIEGRRRQ